MENIISVKNIGKKYDIQHQQGRYIALRDILASIFKNPFRFLKTKTKQIIGIEKKEEFWALKEVNFEVKKGEVIGIIGRNGAGKSTLLKILSQITPPTEGEIKINGRIGSLLEVGTGFHPELTGRENIFLNGAILGMKKKEIAEKFDQIVEFAGIEKFLDTPVKHYSSGMYVRLAFSVAAHMEPDILIIDEVLAVGDAEFQKKCLGKMDEITKTEGRTILFVSHNMEAIKALCKRAILLEKGKVIGFGETNEMIHRYISSPRERVGNNLATDSIQNRLSRETGRVLFTKVSCINIDGSENKMWSFRSDESPEFHFECEVKEPANGLTFLMILRDSASDIQITNLKKTILKRELVKGEHIIFKLNIQAEMLRPGQYDVYLCIGDKNFAIGYDVLDKNISLPPLTIQAIHNDQYENSGLFSLPFKIEVVENDK